MIYKPREDSYLLQKYVKKFVKSTHKVLDIGTGSGIQALTAIQIAKDVTASDINPECIKKLKKEHPEIKSICSNLFKNLPKKKYDIIIFNPPYLPENKKEPKDSALSTTGGKKGHEIIEKFLKQAKSYLKPDGKILLVFSSLTRNINELIKSNNYDLRILEEKSFFFEKLYVSVLTKK